MKNITLIVFSIVFTLIGLGGGYLATAPKASSAPAEAGAEHGAEKANPGLSPQALANLGVTLAPAETKAFVRHRDIPAAVVEVPTTVKIVLAPVGGRILKLNVVPGSVVAGGAVLYQILRDPLPRPTYTLTEEILKFTNEDLHRTAADLRKAAGNVALVKIEMDRLTQLADNGAKDGTVLVPKKNLIDARYELGRAENDLNNARLELRQHGYTPEQIQAVEAGTPLAASGQLAWKQAFERHGLWNARAEALRLALAEQARNLPWNVAAIGELAASGLIDDALVSWVKDTPAIAPHFQNVCALIQQGHSLEDVRILCDQNMLDSIVTVSAPLPVAGAQEDWDVREIVAHAGERVEAGAHLIVLDNPRLMFLKVVPSGSDAAAISSAHEKDSALEAVPLIDGSGPALKNLKIARLEGDESASGATALISLRNEPVRAREEGALGTIRSWRLRKGIKYMLRVPIQEFKDVFVLPNDAVTDDGPDKIIFIEDGKSFKPLKVEVLYFDHEFAVIANNKNTELFPGDSVVQHGAFGLYLALKASAGGGGEHEGGEGEEGGHHHHHHHH